MFINYYFVIVKKISLLYAFILIQTSLLLSGMSFCVCLRLSCFAQWSNIVSKHKHLICSTQFQSFFILFVFSWKHEGVEASPCFWHFWAGNRRQFSPARTLLYISFRLTSHERHSLILHSILQVTVDWKRLILSLSSYYSCYWFRYVSDQRL